MILSASETGTDETIRERMRENMTTWDRNSEGAWRATWIDSAGCLQWRVFYGYSKREAARLLREYRQPV